MALSGCRQQKPTLPFRIRLAVGAGVGGEGWAGGGSSASKGRSHAKSFGMAAWSGLHRGYGALVKK